MNNNRFKRGSGCFKCDDCGKLTRDTGGNGQCELCPDCFDIAGIENMISDYGDPDGKYQVEINAIRASQSTT